MQRTAPRGKALPHDGQPDAVEGADTAGPGGGTAGDGGGVDDAGDGMSTRGAGGAAGTISAPWQVGQLICMPAYPPSAWICCWQLGHENLMSGIESL
ncbi:MAG TPA: hypothetical protein VNU68_26085 [Verrucomicrobiae bacterium]|nr:hypothetical protein [Verrucomicrobiae bacterium]